MRPRHRWMSSLALLFLVHVAPGAEEAPLPPADKGPVLRVEAGGPTARVTALAFGPGGKTLYVGGYDKLVRVWRRNARGRFEPAGAYRLPVGPGADGVVNALALSPDGRWLAAAGLGVMRDAGTFGTPAASAMYLPTTGGLTTAMLRDRGNIYLFDTRNPPPARSARVLRGHAGTVLALTFAPARKGKPPLLVSLANESSGDGPRGVLRLWDVDTAKVLATSDPLPDPRNGRPGLAAWHTGDESRKLRVAVAAFGEPLRIWKADADRDNVQEVGKSHVWNDTVAFVPSPDSPEAGTVVAAGFGKEARGRIGVALRKWAIKPGAAPTGETWGPVREPDCVPSALTVLPQADGTAGHFALVVRYKAREGEKVYPLGLLILDRKRGAVKRDLWTGKDKAAIAAAPDGSFLAVAGHPGHEVLVFARDDLLADGAGAPQRLRSDGAVMASVAFVTRGKDRGLRLIERLPGGGPPPRPLYFDFRRNRLTADPKGWKPDAPALGEWSVTRAAPVPKEGPGFVIKKGEVQQGRIIRLGLHQLPTAHALLPPREPWGVPLLAIAYEERGVTSLGLYTTRGQQVRMYAGHVNPIRHLAFDARGERLVSAADDQTVCVWSLSDLGDTLGKKGLLRGLAVDRRGEELVVARLDDAGRDPANLLSGRNRSVLDEKGVKAGDVIEGLVVGAKVQPLKTPYKVYDAVWAVAPGKAVVLRIKGRGDVRLTADQGIDWRLPLFSLFVTRGGKGITAADRHWIGWSPGGPYDVDQLGRAEEYIGWHRNTGDPKAPAQFATAAEYRKLYHKEGVLRRLLETGRPEDDEPPPRPSTRLWIEETRPGKERYDPAGRRVVQRPDILHAEVAGIRDDQIAKLQWQLDDGPVHDFGPSRDADLSRLKWKRGPHVLTLLLTTTGSRPARYRTDLRLHYLPLPPTLTFPGAWLRKHFPRGAPELTGPRATLHVETDEKAFRLEAAAERGTGASGVLVRVLRDGKAVAVPPGGPVDWSLTLKPGKNELEIRAENEGVPADPDWPLRDLESVSRRVVVHYKVPPAPEISLDSVEPASGTTAERGGFLIVHSRRVRVRGVITAARGLTAAAHILRSATATDTQPLTGFRASARSTRFAFEEEVVLQPGRQTLTFTARAKDVEATPVVRKLEYHPDLPRLDPAGRPPGEREADEPLVFKLPLPLTAGAYEPFRARVVVNGEAVAKGDVDLDRGPPGRVTAAVKLHPGENVLGVRLENDYWGRDEEVRIYCKRPPRITAFGLLGGKPPVLVGASLPTDRMPVDLVWVVKTPEGLPLTTARLLRPAVVDLDPRTFEKGDLEEGLRTWRISTRGVPVTHGTNQVVLRVANKDGYHHAAAVLEYARKAPPAVTIESTDLPPVMITRSPKFAFGFQVRSAGRLSSVRVLALRDGGDWVLLDPARVVPDPERPATRELKAYKVELTLAAGVNQVKVVAVNEEGGIGERVGQVSYTPPPVRLSFTRLVTEDGPLRILDLTDKTTRLDVPVGRVRVEGYVEWDPSQDDLLRERLLRVRVLVNNFEQVGGLLQEAIGRRRSFRASLRLNRELNRVELMLPDLPLEAGQRREFTVACRKPEKQQRLNLVLMGPGERNPERLYARARRAFLVEEKKDGELRTPAFERVRIYPALPGDFKREQALGALQVLKSEINGTRSPYNEVVIVYYHGQSEARAGKHYLHTLASLKFGRPLREAALELDDLRKALSEVRGAKMLLMETRRSGGTLTPPAGGPFRQIGLFEYAWLSDKETPREASLLDALNSSLERARLLRDVKEKIADRLKPYMPPMRVFSYIPRTWEELRLGMGAGK